MCNLARAATKAAVLARRLRVVTLIAARCAIREHEPEVRTLLDRDDVIGVQMPRASRVRLAQFLQRVSHWRNAHARFAKDPYAFGLPSAIDTAELVALKDEHAPAPVIRAVSALCRLRTLLDRSAAALMPRTPATAFPGFNQFATSTGIRTWALRD